MTVFFANVWVVFFLCLGGGGLAYFYLFINFVAGVCVCVYINICKITGWIGTNTDDDDGRNLANYLDSTQ